MIARLSVSLFLFRRRTVRKRRVRDERAGPERETSGSSSVVGMKRSRNVVSLCGLGGRVGGCGLGGMPRENRVGSVGGFFRTRRGVGPVGKCGPSSRTPATGWENWGFGTPIRRMRAIVDSDAASGKLVRFLLDRKRGDRAEIVIFARRICRNFIS